MEAALEEAEACEGDAVDIMAREVVHARRELEHHHLKSTLLRSLMVGRRAVLRRHGILPSHHHHPHKEGGGGVGIRAKVTTITTITGTTVLT